LKIGPHLLSNIKWLPFFIQSRGVVLLQRVAMHNAAYVVRCPSVCLSRSCVVSKTLNTIIFKIFSPSDGGATIIVFRTKRVNGGVECMRHVQHENRNFRPTNIPIYLGNDGVMRSIEWCYFK